jgi:RNA polymerase sigma-70 factor (ECF subfamily)
MGPRQTPKPVPGDDPLSRTQDLLQRARGGDGAALNSLFDNFRVPLEKYLHAQLPPFVRSFQDTQDAVQEVLIRTFQSLDHYQHKGVGSLWGYMRTIARNYVAESWRERRRWGTAKGGDDLQFGGLRDKGPSPPEKVTSSERYERYEAALGKIPVRSRNAFLMRIELGADYKLIAKDCGFASGDAARMAVKRAAESIAHDMGAGEALEK